MSGDYDGPDAGMHDTEIPDDDEVVYYSVPVPPKTMGEIDQIRSHYGRTEEEVIAMAVFRLYNDIGREWG